MSERHVVVIGGGLAGLAAGCYARRSGYRVTLVEHNDALGGQCTSWRREPYSVDGCIHWLTGGPYARLYEELEIVPPVSLRTLDHWVTYRDATEGLEIAITADVDKLIAQLIALSPADANELSRVRDGASIFRHVAPPIEPGELLSVGDRMRAFWEMRDAAGPLVHFRQSIADWSARHLQSWALRRFFTHVLPETAPASFLLMVLGYLQAGYLSRPMGGSAAFRDALVGTYLRLGGEALLGSTVDEVMTDHGRVVGVVLASGQMLPADVVVSTSSAPESVLRLLGGQYDADATRERLQTWKVFDPIVLVSLGVARSFADVPSLLTIDRVAPLDIGGRSTDYFYLRIGNDDPVFAPAGHSLVQLMARTDYTWWATRAAEHEREKARLAERVIAHLEPHLPGIGGAVRMVDVATPVSYAKKTRAWRGAHEGWVPTPENFFAHPKKTLLGLAGFYMAGQWVEPGGGVPTAVMSGRQAIQLLCRDDNTRFVAKR
jgi:phytoene dehydrogenase-like protein